MHAPTTGEVGLGDERESRTRQHHAALERCHDDVDVDALGTEQFAQPRRRPGALRREHDSVALAFERAQPARQRVGVADDRVERRRRDARCVGVLGRRQQRHRACRRVREQSVERERQTREVTLAVVACLPRDGQRGGERGFVVEQVLRAVAHALGLDEQRERVGGQQVGEEVFALREPR